MNNNIVTVFLTLCLTVSTATAEAYRPNVTGNIADLHVDAAKILRHLPGVVSVEVKIAADKPTHRIIHLRDWHLVSKESFAADLRDQNKKIKTEEIDRHYADHLDKVEAIQEEQMTLLRCLIKYHGLKAVCIEGLATRDKFILDAQVRVLRKNQPDIRELRKQRDGLAELDGDDDTKKLLADIDGILSQNRIDRMRIGAAGRLLVSGELGSVIGIEDEQAHRAAQPVQKDGRIVLDQAKIEAREDAQVKNMNAGGHFSFVVLGAAHDLADNVERLEVDVELIVVTTGRVATMMARSRFVQNSK